MWLRSRISYEPVKPNTHVKPLNCPIVTDCNAHRGALLCSELKTHLPCIQIIACCHNIADTKEEIHKTQPHLLVINLENCQEDGFGFLKTIDRTQTEVIVISPFSKRLALKTFNIRALPLIMPYETEQFKKVIEIALQGLEWKKMSEQQLRLTIMLCLLISTSFLYSLCSWVIVSV